MCSFLSSVLHNKRVRKVNLQRIRAKQRRDQQHSRYRHLYQVRRFNGDVISQVRLTFLLWLWCIKERWCVIYNQSFISLAQNTKNVHKPGWVLRLLDRFVQIGPPCTHDWCVHIWSLTRDRFVQIVPHVLICPHDWFVQIWSPTPMWQIYSNSTPICMWK